VSEARTRPRPVADKIALWNRELFEELLPMQEEPDVPVVLACDDETLRVVGERLGYDAAGAAAAFALDVKVAFDVGLLNGFKYAVREPFETLPRPRPLPRFFSLLCLWVLAASRMGADEKYPTSEYYGRLNGLLEIRGDDKLPQFEFIEALFPRFGEWLADDRSGERGRLLLPDSPRPPWVGLAVSQTVFRARDREVLSQFFSERLRTLQGFDPLRRLRRWSGRHRLTSHALRMLDDEQAEERVRAGIRSAFNAWDGSELIVTPSGFGRVWPARLHLLPYPQPRLQLGAGNTKPLEIDIDGTAVVLDSGAEVEVGWALIDRLRQRALQLGDARSPAGALRLPQLGDTIAFELGDLGLLRVDCPSAETVWVLTRDGALQEQLTRRRLSDRGVLPDWWQLFREVPLEELPDVERAPAPHAQEPLRISSGLPLGQALYLSGFAPVLEAGELDLADDEFLPVSVNGELIGLIRSGERLALRAGEPGTYRVVVGDGDFTASYDVEAAGEPSGVGSLGHRLDGPAPLQSGARPLSGDSSALTMCGAGLSSAYDGVLPILTRSGAQLATIDRRGELEIHPRPPTPAWFAEVGFDEAGRWEIFRHDVVWLISPHPPSGRPWVRRVDTAEVEALGPAAARLVSSIGAEPPLSTTVGDCAEARRQWAAIVNLAGSAE
jgi:hypothetical protein